MLSNEEEVVLKGRRCLLRLAQAHDAKALGQFYQDNQEHLAPWEPVMPKDFLLESFWATKIEDMHREFRENRTKKFLLFLSDNKTLIGMINFSRIERGIFQCCGLGYKISKDYQGQGLMKEGLEVAIDYIFNQCNFHRIEANFIPSNSRSEKLLRALGFEKEGYAKNYLKIAGVWQDHVLNSLTNSQWRDL